MDLFFPACLALRLHAPAPPPMIDWNDSSFITERGRCSEREAERTRRVASARRV